MTETTDTLESTEITGTAAAVETASAPVPSKRQLPYAAVFLIRVGVTAAALWLLLTFVINVNVCHSSAGYPMVKDGDLCLSFRLAAPAAGDVTVYRYNNETRIGRIVALEGDTVEISDGILLINGESVMIPAVYATSAEGSAIDYPYTVPEGCVFVLNDYRGDTSDSRTAGGIPLTDCHGKVIFLMRRRGI